MMTRVPDPRFAPDDTVQHQMLPTSESSKSLYRVLARLEGKAPQEQSFHSNEHER